MRRGSTRSHFNALVPAAILTSVLVVCAGNARAADAERGKLLYENHCKVCHTSVVHVREDRKAGSRQEVRTWIQRWTKELGLQWGPAEVDDVIEYLNERYYKFKDQS